MRWILVLLFLLVGCCDCPVVPDGDDFEVTFSPERAQRGEEVTATLSVDEAANARVLIGGVEVDPQVASGNTLIFEVPEEVKSGPQEVLVLLEDEASASQTLGVLGDDVVPDRVIVILEPLPEQTAIDEDALENFLIQRGFELIEFSSLAGDIGPCSGELGLIDIGDVPLGQALEELEELEEEGIAIPSGIDGQGAHAGGQTDHLSAIRAGAAFELGLGGEGVTIAVLDSGVSEHVELQGRLLSGYNAIADNTDTVDTDPHGTPVAVLAAGNTLGVAPEALVLPVKVCENGVCLASNIIKGGCWALENAPDGPEALVMNLSLGGDNPSEIIEALLGAAIDNGTSVAASGGNQGETGSPRHYPAAHDLGGLVAVAAVAQCASFDDLQAGSFYEVGDAFTSGPARVSVEPFIFSNGEPFGDGAVTVEGSGGGNALFMGNVNLDFDFGGTLELLTLRFGEFGGNLNLEINGDFRNLGSLFELDGQTVGGVAVSVSVLPTEEGLLTLGGPIESFSIGGQELTIDDVCAGAGATGAWFPADFSTRGDYLDVAAPGVSIASGIPGPAGGPSSDLAIFSGTSFSTPLVAGTMAILREADASLSPAQIQACIEEGAQTLPFSQAEVGAGLLNVAGALEACGL